MPDDERDEPQPAVQFPEEMDEQFAHDLDLFGLLQSLEWFLSEYPLRDEVAESVAERVSEGNDTHARGVVAVLAALREDLQDREVEPEIDKGGETATFNFGSGEAEMNLEAIEAAFEGSDLGPDDSE
jgi:hypothetical protein